MTSTSYVFELRQPPNWRAEELEVCLGLLAQGGAVDIRYASMLLPNAVAVALVRHENEIVGVAALKMHRAEYAEQISKRSRFKLPSEALELGYVVVSESHRGKGLAATTVDRLMAIAAAPVFATTYEPAMLHILGKRGFEICGETWKARDGETLRLLFRDHNESNAEPAS